jgi:hypothetical protein
MASCAASPALPLGAPAARDRRHRAPPARLRQVARVFGGFVGSFISWAGRQVLSLLQIIFEVVAPGAMPYLRRAMGAFAQIVRDPVGFIRNLVPRGVQGFRQFAGNFLHHLRRSLIGWLTGTLGGTGIYIPQAFELREIIKFVLSVLGLTWQNIRASWCARSATGRSRCSRAGSSSWRRSSPRAPAAAWEKIREHLANLREMVMGQVMTFVRERIVQAAITRLLTSLNPAGRVHPGRARDLQHGDVLRRAPAPDRAGGDVVHRLDLGDRRGRDRRGRQPGRADDGRLLTLVISFLARLVGLGNVSQSVVGIVNRIRAPIDRALDRIVDWIIAQARRLGRFIAQAGLPQDPVERLRLGTDAAVAAANRFAGRPVGAAVLQPLLAAIRMRYGLRTLIVVPDGPNWAVQGSNSPAVTKGTRAKREGAAAAAADAEWSVADTPGTVAAETVQPVQDPEQRPAAPAAPEPGAAYVANVPAIPTNPAKPIVDIYADQGFSGGVDEAKRRFGLVIGVNAMDDLRGANAAALAGYGRYSRGYPVAIVRFLWRPQWKRHGVNVAFDVAKSQLTDPARIARAEAGAANQRTIPYGAIRQFILDRPVTRSMIGALRSYRANVYVHTGDPDVASMRQSQPGLANALRVSTGPAGRALFDRYDELIRENPTPSGDPPVIVTGGYRFRFRPEGDLRPSVGPEILTAIASELDMAIRQAMAATDPRTVYFPEPNTIIRTDGVNLSAIYQGGRNEGEGMVRRMLDRLGVDGRWSIVFNEVASIVSQTKRFVIEGVEGEARVTIGKLRDLTRPQLISIFRIAQSHADYATFEDRIAGTYRDANRDEIRQLAHHYWPQIRYDFDPGLLKTQLGGFTPGPPSPTLLAGMRDPSDRADVIAMVRDTGQAARRFLMELFAVTGGSGGGGGR